MKCSVCGSEHENIRRRVGGWYCPDHYNQVKRADLTKRFGNRAALNIEKEPKEEPEKKSTAKSAGEKVRDGIIRNAHETITMYEKQVKDQQKQIDSLRKIIEQHKPDDSHKIEATGIELMVCREIENRQKVGISKYKTTVLENPLYPIEWIQHALEECLDMSVYLMRLKYEINDVVSEMVRVKVEEMKNA